MYTDGSGRVKRKRHYLPSTYILVDSQQTELEGFKKMCDCTTDEIGIVPQCTRPRAVGQWVAFFCFVCGA